MGETSFLPALAALASAATWALGSHLFRRAMTRSDPAIEPNGEHGIRHGVDHASTRPGLERGRAPTAAAANLFKNALAFALFAAVFVAWSAGDREGGSSSELPDVSRWWPLFASGACGFAIGDTLFFAALPRCGVQVAAMVGLVHVPAAVALGWILHGEQLAPWALVGAATIVAGVALVLTESPRGAAILRPAHAARTRRIGVLCAALGAVAQAVAVVTGHDAMQGVDVLGGTLVRISGGIVGAFVLATLVGLARPSVRVATELADLVRPWRERSARRGLVLAAVFGSILGLPLFHLALRGLPSGVAAVLIATTPLFTLPLGLALGERHGLRAVVGAVLGLAGVAVVVAATT